jgi:hypothetical protein
MEIFIHLKWNMAIAYIFLRILSLTIGSAWISFLTCNWSKLCSACIYSVSHEPGLYCTNRPSCLRSKEPEELPDLLYADIIGSKNNGYDAMLYWADADRNSLCPSYIDQYEISYKSDSCRTKSDG